MRPLVPWNGDVEISSRTTKLTFPRRVMAAKSLASGSASDCSIPITVPQEPFYTSKLVGREKRVKKARSREGRGGRRVEPISGNSQEIRALASWWLDAQIPAWSRGQRGRRGARTPPERRSSPLYVRVRKGDAEGRWEAEVIAANGRVTVAVPMLRDGGVWLGGDHNDLGREPMVGAEPGLQRKKSPLAA